MLPNKASALPDQYLIVFKSGVKAAANAAWFQDLSFQDTTGDSVSSNGIKRVYDMGSFQGLAGRFHREALDQIQRHPDVEYVEQNHRVYITETQRGAPWGLARVSHRKFLTLKTYDKYEYDSSSGEGVTVFVLDTGIYIDHVEFEGRASWDINLTNEPDLDEHGHGTHCAGTVASRAYGVAKKANVVAVKVARKDGTADTSDIIAGVEYARQQHLELSRTKGTKHRGAVISMSLASPKSRAMNAAVASAVAAGVHVVVGAGNENDDACKLSPASAEDAITVGASDINDNRASFSNYGPCTDIFAPGVDVLSTWIGSPEARHSGGGTSMATPHVAGLVAYFLGLASNTSSDQISPKEMKEFVIARGTRDLLKDIPSGTPNLLAYNFKH